MTYQRISIPSKFLRTWLLDRKATHSTVCYAIKATLLQKVGVASSSSFFISDRVTYNLNRQIAVSEVSILFFLVGHAITYVRQNDRIVCYNDAQDPITMEQWPSDILTDGYAFYYEKTNHGAPEIGVQVRVQPSIA